MDKTDLLRQICENPGLSAPTGFRPDEAVAIDELVEEGWVLTRGLGYLEATAQALTCHPNFYIDDDGHVRGEQTVGPPESETPPQVIDLARAAVWCDYCKAMVQLVRRGKDAMAPDALGCMGCGRVIGHAEFWK